MKKILAKIFSYSPILAITDDNNFGTNELKGTQASYRFSLLNIFLGHIAIYFITYNLCYKNFSLFHKIVMEECGDLYYKCNVETINKKTQKYVEEHLNTLSNEDIAIEKNFIIYLNSNECERIELSERKINLYTTIVLAIIPLMLTFFDLKTFFLYAIHEKILALLIIYSLINVVLFVLNSTKVRGMVLSKFCTLRLSKDKIKTSLSNYYFDWQMHREKADIWVSYVKNIEDWIKIAIVCAILLTVTSSIQTPTEVKTLDSGYSGSSNVVLTANINE